MNFRPIRTEIVLEYIENKPAGDILLPNNGSVTDYSMFHVIAVGDGFLSTNGWIPLPVKVGDRVQLKATAQGVLAALPPWLVDDRKLAVIDVMHVAGVWEGELPEPKINRKIVMPAPGMLGAKDKSPVLAA